MFRYEFAAPNARRAMPEVFENSYSCFSMAMVDKSHLDGGDKILLPPSALRVLSHMEVEYPLLFELRNDMMGKRTHGGVIEFTAEEGKCHLPFGMMRTLMVSETETVFCAFLLFPPLYQPFLYHLS